MLKNNNIFWPEGCYCEDKLFVTKAVYFANSVVSVPDIYYYYFRNPDSTVNSKKTKKYLKRLQEDKNNARISVVNFLRDKNADIRDREFWAVTKEVSFLSIPLLKIKESLKTRITLLFALIPIAESEIK